MRRIYIVKRHQTTKQTRFPLLSAGNSVKFIEQCHYHSELEWANIFLSSDPIISNTTNGKQRVHTRCITRFMLSVVEWVCTDIITKTPAIPNLQTVLLKGATHTQYSTCARVIGQSLSDATGISPG